MTGDLLERIRGWRCPTHLARDPFVELSDLLTGKGGGLMFYFGCGEESGHFLFDADAHRVPRHHIPRDFPFGNYDGIDGTFCPPGEQVQGRIAIWRADGWAVLSWWDRSVDTRPGSHSTFVLRTQGNPTDRELVRSAVAAFPWVFARIRFKLSLPDGSTFIP